MKSLSLCTGLIVLVLSIFGCAAPTTVPTPVKTVPTVFVVTATPQSVSPTPIIATSEPQIDLGETKTYRDKFAGFEFDYPASWNLTPIGEEAKKNSVIYSATFFSWMPKGGGSEGIPEGETKIDVGVIKNNAPSPEAALALRKQEFANGDLEQKILREETWTLANGLQATRLAVSDRFGQSSELVTAINGNTILFGGVGDEKLFDAIVKTLRPL